MRSGSAPIWFLFALYRRRQAAQMRRLPAPCGRRSAAIIHSESPRRTTTVRGVPLATVRPTVRPAGTLMTRSGSANPDSPAAPRGDGPRDPSPGASAGAGAVSAAVTTAPSAGTTNVRTSAGQKRSTRAGPGAGGGGPGGAGGRGATGGRGAPPGGAGKGPATGGPPPTHGAPPPASTAPPPVSTCSKGNHASVGTPPCSTDATSTCSG